MSIGGRGAANGGIDVATSDELAHDFLPSSAMSLARSAEAVSSDEFVRFEPHRVISVATLPSAAPHGATGPHGASRPLAAESANDSRRAAAERWQRRYQVSLVGIDALAAALASVVALSIRFGGVGNGKLIDFVFCALMPVAWVAVIACNRAYETRFVGVGSAEFERVFRAFMHLTVLTVFLSYATQAQLARGYILIALPLALVFDIPGRYLARKRLHRQRMKGQSLKSVLAVGGPATVAEFTALLRRDRYAGMRVVGACLPVDNGDNNEAGAALAAINVQLLGDVDTIVESARRCGADTVAVLSGETSADKLRWISWQLEGTDTDLVVSPGLTEVGGRRLHIQPVAGLPLLHIDQPEFTGFRRMVKGAFDRTLAATALLILSPIMVAVAAAVRFTSTGPALFRQTRIGVGGNAFTVYKFRSMCVDAEARVAELQDRNENADGLLFKIKADPRITRVGAFIRRYSLDELPQLINVIKGDMSLVGPRPPLPSEVAQYGADVRRRLLVKPGITGLWQISGRSDLSWEESVRLDLHYVENWSLATDMVILWKTGFAVARSSGAY